MDSCINQGVVAGVLVGFKCVGNLVYFFLMMGYL